MKKIKSIVIKSLPILFLLMAFTFMTVFKHEETLSDRDKVDFKTISQTDHTIDRRAQLENDRNMNEDELTAENENEYKVNSDDETVTVLDKQDNQVVEEIPKEEWENNKDFYNKEYNLN